MPAMVNPTIYRGGHFLFTAAGTFARHGKSIYRGRHIKMPATVNTLFTVADNIKIPPRKRPRPIRPKLARYSSTRIYRYT